MAKAQWDEQRTIIGNWAKAMNAELERLDWPLRVVFQPSKQWNLYSVHANELHTAKQPKQRGQSRGKKREK